MLRISSDMNSMRISLAYEIFLREANKAALADAIWAAARGDETPVLCKDESASIT